MKLCFHTNLDEAKGDVSRLGYEVNDAYGNSRSGIEIPRKGDRIVFPFVRWDPLAKREGSFTYELEVCSVAFNYAQHRVEVELHVPSYYASMPLNEYLEWFGRHRHGRGLPPIGTELNTTKG